LAAELVESKGFKTSLTVGGADNGYDFELLDTTSEPGPGVVTTSDRVTDNLRRNLKRNKAKCPRAAKKTYIVTSSVLTSVKRDNLKKTAHEYGYVYLGASDRYEVARYIYAHPHWALELLNLTGQPSALSVVPRSSRPLTDVPLVGRKDSEERLRGLSGDGLLVGCPGSGKTALLTRLVIDGMGSFLVSTDMTAVANALRQQRPRMVIIDDLEDATVVTRDLARLRRDIDADFRIVVTDWEINAELQQALGLTDAGVITLDRLTRDEIVSVVGSVGVVGPVALVREIVNQAEGVPGLAVTLTQAALAGDYRNLFDGNRLGSLMESTVNRLSGSPREGERAILALGAIALAGDAGLTVEEIADYVGGSKADLQSLLKRLASGGIIRSDRRRVTLRPRPLRSYMIRKAFFSAVAPDYAPLLGVVPDLGQTAKELVLASRAGAPVPNLLEIVIKSDSVEAARYYAGSGGRQARELLEAAPGLTIHVAREALHSAPETVIPMLLQLGVDDQRELSSTPEHPIRLIKDWGNGGVPGRGEAVARKRTVIKSSLKWVAGSGDFKTACRACAEVLRTVFEGGETDPGAGMTFRLVRGMLTDEEIAELSVLWGEIRAAIEMAGDAPWPALLSTCWDLMHPHVFGEHPAELHEKSRRFGESVIKDVGNLAAAHPGVLDRLNTMRRQLGHSELYAVPEDYSALFGEQKHPEWIREEQERVNLIKELAEKWVPCDPAAFASRLGWLETEARIAGSGGYDRSPALCHNIAERVVDPARWVTVLADVGVPPACLLPFLDRAIHCEPDNWDAIAVPILNNPALEPAAVDVALRAPHVTDRMWSVLSPKLARYRQLVEVLCMRRQVPVATLPRLLRHDSSEVAHAAAVGMWNGKTRGAIPDELKPEWEDAVVRIDDEEYWLEEILASSPAMAIRWLEARLENKDWSALSNEKNVGAAAAGMSDEQRLDMLRKLPTPSYLEETTTALIGESDNVYRQVLRDQKLSDHWEDPLRRGADSTWRRYAGIALEEGRTPREVAAASMPRSASWSGPYSAYVQGQIEEFAVWLEDPDEGVQEVARVAIEWLSARQKQALARERKEAIDGHE
jgi:hypothetical protein